MHSALSHTRLALAATSGAVGVSAILLDNHNRNNNVSLPQAGD